VSEAFRQRRDSDAFQKQFNRFEQSPSAAFVFARFRKFTLRQFAFSRVSNDPFERLG